MPFNISEIRQTIGAYHQLTSAELRMLIKKPTMQSEQRVELYQGLGPSARYLASRFVSSQSKNKWLFFDVTEPLQQWLQGNGKTEIKLASAPKIEMLKESVAASWPDDR